MTQVYAVNLCKLLGISPEIHFKYNYIGSLKVKEWKKMYHENSNQKKAQVAI